MLHINHKSIGICIINITFKNLFLVLHILAVQGKEWKELIKENTEFGWKVEEMGEGKKL